MECEENKCKSSSKDVYVFIMSFVLVIFTLILVFLFLQNNVTLDQISSYVTSGDAIAVPVGDAIAFSTNRVVEGTSINHAPGSTDFVINEDGNYYVAFNVSAFEPADPGIAAILSVSLQQNGTTVVGSTARGTVAAAFQVVNLSSSVIVEASAGDTLTVVNDSTVPIEVLQPNINIIKIG